MDPADIEHYHRIRNKLYHDGTGLSVDPQHLLAYRQIEVSRQNMTKAALIGHQAPKTKKERTNLSRKLSDHAVANTWWSPSSLPDWLNETFYVQSIQPQLRTIKVRELAGIMNVSQPYAALIRAGDRIRGTGWR